MGQIFPREPVHIFLSDHRGCEIDGQPNTAVLKKNEMIACSVATRRRGLVSFPEAMHFSIVTISTVGYGDIVPATLAGGSDV